MRCFSPGTVSNTLYPFQELVCFMIVYFCQNLFLFRNYILFRNCFCQTNPFQELFLSNKSFSGMVFSKKLSFDVPFEQKNYMIPIRSEVSLPFSKPIAYRPLSGTVISDAACFKTGQFLIRCNFFV